MAQFVEVYIVGDEIHFNGYVVGILAQTGVPASVLATFVDEMNNGTIFEPDADVPKCPECKVEPKHLSTCSHYEDNCGEKPEYDEPEYDLALQDVELCAKEYAKAGLLKLADLATICKKLKEETDEAPAS